MFLHPLQCKITAVSSWACLLRRSYTVVVVFLLQLNKRSLCLWKWFLWLISACSGSRWVRPVVIYNDDYQSLNQSELISALFLSLTVYRILPELTRVDWPHPAGIHCTLKQTTCTIYTTDCINTRHWGMEDNCTIIVLAVNIQSGWLYLH